MSLNPGARLGPYEILTALGAGGMGEVYKARDTRLDRTVAIKILPETLAGDPQFRERFDREARTISQLDHPHICTLFDVGEQNPSTPSTGSGQAGSGQAVAYLVMQYLEGETLETRLTKGPLPLTEALTTAIQIASALDKAHRAGVTHRDLKPGNIFLVRSGGASAPPIAKLLDFGLAKAMEPAGTARPDTTNSPTLSLAVTQAGMILGTAAYMSPDATAGSCSPRKRRLPRTSPSRCS